MVKRARTIEVGSVAFVGTTMTMAEALQMMAEAARDAAGACWTRWTRSPAA